MKTTWGKRQRPVDHKQVLRIFRDKFYIGIIQTKRWGEFKGLHQAMVSENTFLRVQEVLSGRRPSMLSYQRNNPDFPMRRFYKCEECGKYFTGAWSKGRKKRYPYYFCPTHRANVKRKLAHQKFIRMLGVIKPSREYVTLFCEVLKERYKEKVEQIKSLSRNEEAEILKLEEMKQNLIEKNLKGIYEDTLFKEQMEKINSTIEQKKSKRVVNNLMSVDMDKLTQFMETFLSNLDSIWSAGTLQERKLIQGSIFPNGLVYGDLDYRTIELSDPFRPFCVSHLPSGTYGVGG